MEARILAAAVLVVCGNGWAADVWAGNYRTTNFMVTAESDQFAKKVGDEAERFRKELALEWLGEELPNWSQPCPIRVDVGDQLGAGGATSFSFHRGEVFGWQMQIQGPADRVLDAVLPHEITHTIFADHFRQPLPRWADEGACTTVEHVSERSKQERMLIEFLKTNRGIAFSKMFAMRDYPPDIMPLYSQGYSLARFLIHRGGRRKFVDYIGEGLKSQDWIAVTEQFYEYPDLAALQSSWLDWVRQGSPNLAPQSTPDVQLASHTPSEPAPPSSPTSYSKAPVFRGQSDDRSVPPSSAEPISNTDNLAWIPSRNRYQRTAAGSPVTQESVEPATTVSQSPKPNGPQILLEWTRPAPPAATVARPMSVDAPTTKGSIYRR